MAPSQRSSSFSMELYGPASFSFLYHHPNIPTHLNPPPHQTNLKHHTPSFLVSAYLLSLLFAGQNTIFDPQIALLVIHDLNISSAH